MSIAPAPLAPTASLSRQATEGEDSGAVVVAQITRSIASPERPERLSASLEASMARVTQSSPTSTNLRSRIPVRATIQASSVSITCARSWLETTRPPRARPTPTIFPTASRSPVTLINAPVSDPKIAGRPSRTAGGSSRTIARRRPRKRANLVRSRVPKGGCCIACPWH
jgi:hypothetical protein